MTGPYVLPLSGQDPWLQTSLISAVASAEGRYRAPGTFGDKYGVIHRSQDDSVLDSIESDWPPRNVVVMLQNNERRANSKFYQRSPLLVEKNDISIRLFISDARCQKTLELYLQGALGKNSMCLRSIYLLEYQSQKCGMKFSVEK